MQNNRDQLLWLMHETGWKYKNVAQILVETSGRPCSERTVRAWVDDPRSQHYRNCQDWVINQLCGWLLKQGQGTVVEKMQRLTSTAA